MNQKVSIIIPFIRNEKIGKCIEAIKNNSGISKDDYEIITMEDVYRVGCPIMVSKLVKKTKYDWVMFLGDDTIPEENFLHIALEISKQLPDGWGMVGLNDGYQDGNKLATHWMCHKNMLQYTDGDFFHKGYKHQYCDMELTNIAKKQGRYLWAIESKIIHDHPIVQKYEMDDDYRRIYSYETKKHDQELYIERHLKLNGIKLGIGIPLTDDKVDSQFLDSWVLLEKPENFIYLRPRFPGRIEDIRNQIVSQALESGCTHLIMMDTDQSYPSDTLTKLLSHNKDVVGAMVCKRYPPYNPLLLRGSIGHFTKVPDQEIENNDLIEVDATGTGCILFKTDVFFKTDFPWFEMSKTEKGSPVGEDIFFCHKLKDKGYNIFVDTSINIGHITSIEINYNFYKLWKKINNVLDENGETNE